MQNSFRLLLASALGLLSLFAPACARAQSPAPLNTLEQKMVRNIDAHNAADRALLEKLVNINSGTMHLAGVVAVKDVLAPQFQKLGFAVAWHPMEELTHRAGDLVAVHACPAGPGQCGPRLLLIGHMDTVFEPSSPFQGFALKPGTKGAIATGPGIADMKGGIVVMLAALRAMQAAAVLKHAEIRVVLSGDEERYGDPVEIARRDMIDAAKQSDIALEFEPCVLVNGQASVAISRRSSTTWHLETTGVSGHSSLIFGKEYGYGAIYEMTRILDSFRTQLPQYGLTYNVGLILGGSQAEMNAERTGGTAAGKANVIAASALAVGDIRTLNDQQTAETEAKMRAIVAQHLPKTGATISFGEGYPALAATPVSHQLYTDWNAISEQLGLGPVQLAGPMSRGAGDVSFTARYVKGALVGVGLEGYGFHAPGETGYLSSLAPQAERNALLMERLVTGKIRM